GLHPVIGDTLVLDERKEHRTYLERNRLSLVGRAHADLAVENIRETDDREPQRSKRPARGARHFGLRAAWIAVLVHGDRDRAAQCGLRERQCERNRPRAGLHRTSLRVASKVLEAWTNAPIGRFPHAAHDRGDVFGLRIRLDAQDGDRRWRGSCHLLPDRAQIVGNIVRRANRNAHSEGDGIAWDWWYGYSGNSLQDFICECPNACDCRWLTSDGRCHDRPEEGRWIERFCGADEDAPRHYQTVPASRCQRDRGEEQDGMRQDARGV